MNTTTFDTLTAARALEAAGIERRQAQAIAEGMRRAVRKADLAELRADLYRALWIQAAALIGAQLAIAGSVAHLPSQPRPAAPAMSPPRSGRSGNVRRPRQRS